MNQFAVKHRIDRGQVITTGEYATWWEAEHGRVEWLRANGAYGSWIEYIEPVSDGPDRLPIGTVARGLGDIPSDRIAHSTLPLTGRNLGDIPRAEHCPRRGYWLNVKELPRPRPEWLTVDFIIQLFQLKGYRVYCQGDFISFVVESEPCRN